MFNALFRWIIGYFNFTAEGKFPERFINIAARRGISIWNMKGQDHKISATAKLNNLNEIKMAAEHSQTALHIESGHGLRCFLINNKNRAGLLVGLLLTIVLCKTLSGYVWSMSFRLPASINEYEMRAELRESGLYEGAAISSLDLKSIRDQIFVNDNRVGQIFINLTGCRADINVSERFRNDTELRENAVSNIKSSADGTITKMEVANGTAAVSIGEGITKGQLLVSGTMEYTNGTTKLVDSNAHIYARTARSVTIFLPSSLHAVLQSDTSEEKRSLSVFGVRLPLSFASPQTENCCITEKSEQMQVFGVAIPIFYTAEQWQHYYNKTESLNPQRAQKILKNVAQFNELFLLYSAERGRILRKEYQFSETGDGLALTALYEIEEDVAQKSYVEVKAEMPTEPTENTP